MRTVLIKAKESKHTIWSETNFVEYPYFRLGKKNSSDKELRIEIQTPSGTALWLVENTKGLPGVLSYEIFTALEFLIDRNGITADGKLYFSIKDIINLLRWKNAGGREYRTIREAIDKIVDTKIVTDMVLFDKASGKKTYHKNFRLLTGFETVSIEYKDGKTMDISMVTLNSAYLSNRKSGYVTPVSSDTFFRKLENSLARRLYQFLNRRAYYMAKKGECYEVDCLEIGSLMGVCQKFVSDIHKVFSKAHDSLIKIGFINKIEIKKIRARKYSYVYWFNPEFQEIEILERKNILIETRKEDGALLQKLIEYGISHDKATELIEKNEYGVKMVLQQIEYDKKNGNRIKNHAGYIIKFITEGWIVPEYIEAQIKRHENYPKNDKNDAQLSLISEEESQKNCDVSLEEIEKYASKIDKDSLVQIYKQIFEIAKIQTTEMLKPETFDYNNSGIIDSFNFNRIRLIFNGMIADKITEEINIAKQNNRPK